MFASLRWPITLVAVAMCLVGRRAVVVGAVIGAGLAAGSAAWHGVDVPAMGECSGVAVVRTDPESRGARTSAVIEIDGRRWRAIAHGRASSGLARATAGESVLIEASCAPGEGRFARIDRVRHVLGTASVTAVGEVPRPVSRVALASNRLRRALAQGASSMGEENRALFMGLIIGDDRAQTTGTIAAFRAAGLSHLTAVSGQNIAYLLILASPLLALLGRWSRLAVVIGLVGWFVVLTRAEPSVVRAAAMATVSALAVASGSPANGRSVLAVAVLVVLAVDPMLAWSVGFALSVGATAGLAWLSVPLGRLVGSSRVAAVFVPTLAAQVGTAPVSLAVFGTLPVVGLVANPLAVPVAGAVMTLGIPLSLAAVLCPPLSPLVAAVLEPALWWIAHVAATASHLGPGGWLNALSWCAVASLVLWGLRRRRGTSHATG
ncbi:MAG: ComEC/Rec2 family competence protein [Actinomycetota bacterium]